MLAEERKPRRKREKRSDPSLKMAAEDTAITTIFEEGSWGDVLVVLFGNFFLEGQQPQQYQNKRI